jgi:hypothetical protein
MSVPSDEELINAATKYFYYRANTSQKGNIDTVDLKSLQTQKQTILDKITLAEIEEETHNEMYLNTKKNPGSYGLFSKVGLQTTQDWVLAYFFFSYVVLSIVVILTSVSVSTSKLLTFISMTGVLGAIGLVLFLFVISFG